MLTETKLDFTGNQDLTDADIMSAGEIDFSAGVTTIADTGAPGGTFVNTGVTRISDSGQVNFNYDVSLPTLTIDADGNSIGDDPILDGTGDVTVSNLLSIFLTNNIGSDNIDVFIQGTGKLIRVIVKSGVWVN